MSRRSLTILLLSAIALLALVFVAYPRLNSRLVKVRATPPGQSSMSTLERTWVNYEEKVKEVAEEYDLPANYLLALIVLETGGHHPAGKRYEPGVFRRLKNVQSGKRLRYESVRRKHLKDASDEAVRNLATSWGPFQLMGYKCIAMDITVNDLRSDDAVEYGAEWISEEYGHLLRKGRYKDAFHYHNTGRVYPKVGAPRTHDPKYVSKGLGYMDYFKKKLGE